MKPIRFSNKPIIRWVVGFLATLSLSCRPSVSDQDRWLKVDFLTYFVPAGVEVSLSNDRPDRTNPFESDSGPRYAAGRTRAQSFWASHPDLPDGFVQVAQSNWYITSSEIQQPSPETMYGRFEGKFKSDFQLTRPLTDPSPMQFGELSAYGSTWYQADRAVVTVAYATSSGQLYVILAKLPDPGTDPAKVKAHQALAEIMSHIVATP